MEGLARTVLLCIAERLVPSQARGRPRTDPSKVIDAILLVLRSGMSWRCLAHVRDAPDWRTVHHTFTRWSRAHVFRETARALVRLYRRQTRRACRHGALDSTYVKNLRGRDVVGRNPCDRGRRATKVSALVDDTGIPLALAFFPANVSDYQTVDQTLNAMLDAPPRGTPAYADKGYDSRAVRATLRRAGLVDRVFRRQHRTHRVTERRRNVVERYFGWLDGSRRLLVRHETWGHAFASMHYLACARLIGRRLHS